MRDEHGTALVLFSLLLPLFLMLGVISVDIGNWFVHKKRLQTLVDAGALAGATKFVGCSFQFGDPPAANAAVRAAALKYSGDTARDPSTLNTQEQTPSKTRVVLNSSRYWESSTDAVGTTSLDDTEASPGDPCSRRALDVKATDDVAPLLFGFIPVAASPHAHARVEIRQIKEQSGVLPWAVPDLEPAAVAAIFVDENTGAVFDWQRLCNTAVCAGLIPPDDKLSYWMTPGGQDLVDIPSENTSVVILVSKTNTSPTLSTGGAGTLASICNQSPGLVTCYAGSGNTSGLTFIHGWSDAAATPAAPKIRDVRVLDLTCGDDLAAPYFLRAGDCNLGLLANIDFGVTGDPTKKPANGGVSATATLRAPGCGGGGCPMAWQSTSGTESQWMTTNKVATLAADLGRTTFSIDWSTETSDGQKHSGTFTGVAHPYVADQNSGPIDYVKLGTYDSGGLDPNSRNIGPDRSVTATVGVRKPLRLEDPLAPPILLRVASPSGSQNQALDCDKEFNFATEIKNGCQTAYALNYDDFDGDGSKEWHDILCNNYATGDLPPTSTVNDPTPDCVAIQTGDAIGQFRQGLHDRFETPSCTPNNWPQNAAQIHDFFTNYDFANDPRYVTLIVTDSGTFVGSGNDQVPVKYFAGFYATGWDIGGAAKGCPDNDPHPLYGTGYRSSLDNGDVWGHFVNIVVFSAAGTASDRLCNFDELGNCIAVLVE